MNKIAMDTLFFVALTITKDKEMSLSNIFRQDAFDLLTSGGQQTLIGR
ncbi:MAG: copper homeostasis protein CutC [Paraglaciecola sp.]|jgi:copper homeostasis protein CutC